MPNPLEAKPAGVKRVIFKEIVAGDFRKFVAESNDSASGGGARDLRFRPYSKFVKIFRKIFPNRRQAARRRNGASTQVEILHGHFHWLDGNGRDTWKEASFEPPTTARKGEGRIPVVYTYPPFNSLPPTNQGRMVLLIIQRDDDNVWPEFATEASLRSGDWDRSVTRAILKSLDAPRGSHQVARGYIDFVDKEEYSDA